MVCAAALVIKLPASAAADRLAAITANFFMSTPPIRRHSVTTCAYDLKTSRPGRTGWDDEILLLGSPTGWGAIGIGDARRSVASPADDRPGPGIILFLG
jgi:hypothetical protein